jgi:hypothetical protein
MKVIVFTSAYSKRAYMMRQSILSGMNQSYRNFVHSVNITLDDDAQTKDLSPLYNDLLNSNLIVNHSENAKYGFSHFNNMRTIKFVPDYEKYDLFIKMDDDDIYKKHYVKNIVNHFTSNPDIDITSTRIKHQLNGYDVNIRDNDLLYDNLGGNPEGTDYAMPSTFAFTKKALDAIINLTEADVCGHDDLMWRIAWSKHNLKHSLVDNSQDVIWHIHGKNASVGYFLTKKET